MHIIKRLAAYLLDCVLMFVGAALLFNAVLSLIFGPPDVEFLAENPLLLEGRVLLTVSLPTWVYFILSDARFGGQTLGKRLFRLQTVDASGGPVSVGQAVGRTALKLIPWELAHFGNLVPNPVLIMDPAPIQYVVLGIANLLAVAYIVVLIFNGGRRTVHDLAAGTAVSAV